jgi:hypothetical protein
MEIPASFYNDVEKLETLKHILYSDTDSLYIYISDFDSLDDKYRIDKDNKNIENVYEDIIEPLSTKINDAVKGVWKEKVLDKMGISDEWNTIDFKIEYIISKMLFTGKKKRYAYLLHRDGKINFDPPKLKFKGIEVRRTDNSRFTRETLQELVDLIFSGASKEKIMEFVKERKEKFIEHCKNYDFDVIGIPSSWSARGYEKIPTYVYGAYLYNLLIQDICRPGNKGYRIHIKLNKSLIRQIAKKKKGDYILTSDMVQQRNIDVIFIPPTFDKQKIKEVVSKGYFKFDFKTQYEKTVVEKMKTFLEVLS